MIYGTRVLDPINLTINTNETKGLRSVDSRTYGFDCRSDGGQLELGGSTLATNEEEGGIDNYDWDGIVFGRMLSALKRALDIQHAKGKKKLTKTKYTIMGFLHALQVWAYESISTSIGCVVDKVNDDAIPQMLRWMTPEERQLRSTSGELFENPRPSNIVHMKNGGSKRAREVSNDESDFKKSIKQKSKSMMKEAIQKLQDRVELVENQLTSIKSDIEKLKGMMSTILKHIELQKKGDEGDCKGFEGLVDHTLESEEVDVETQDVDIVGTPPWLRMPKKDDRSNRVKHIELKRKDDEDVDTVRTPPWLRMAKDDEL
ncbi:Ulp1-like peptidase [Cucumis melo var. makuwa]|uniref:Ulp1-like peptidase n=1 Tax=Cucumis melo var. makuwa TaxID=1194695 RepID=A0A5A7T8M2_CUCMM|nr:Ulp1-like peptidase [Cucumis melo var. makuwa]TYJ99806.1 Ulp1-like peptidase [Cucumis melo var. makuwa]TYK01711.1 Ulp1-like peptidase [Cucumis melo var. makuwa]